MKPSDTPVLLTVDDLARIDELATFYGVHRNEMIARIVATGIVHQERQVREARARSKRGDS